MDSLEAFYSKTFLFFSNYIKKCWVLWSILLNSRVREIWTGRMTIRSSFYNFLENSSMHKTVRWANYVLWWVNFIRYNLHHYLKSTISEWITMRGTRRNFYFVKKWNNSHKLLNIFHAVLLSANWQKQKSSSSCIYANIFFPYSLHPFSKWESWTIGVCF